MLFAYLENDRVVHSIKTALACLLGYIVTRAINFPVDQWIIITILVVMCAQLNVGSMIQKSYMRFLGTLSGSILAALTLSFFGAHPITIAITIMVASIIFSYIATGTKSYSDAGTLGAVTTTIILISQHPSITVAAERFLEISVGILIAAIVSQFIFPIRAGKHLRHTQIKTILQFREYYTATLMRKPNDDIIASYRKLDEEIVKSLSSQRNLAAQSKREFFSAAFDSKRFNALLHCEKEIFRSIVCMHYAYTLMPSGYDTLASMTEINAFHTKICGTLEKIAKCMEKVNFAETTIIIPSLQPIKEALQLSDNKKSDDDKMYLDGFLFCAELLIIHLTELVVIFKKVKTPHAEISI